VGCTVGIAEGAVGIAVDLTVGKADGGRADGKLVGRADGVVGTGVGRRFCACVI